MPNYPKNLFESDVDALKWGVTPGGHVAHLIDPKTTPVYSEISAEVMTRDKFSSHSYDYKKVSQAEAYNNVGDNLTSVTFTRLARKAAAEYARPNITDAYRDTLLQVKKIVTAGGRQEQQDAIRSFKEKASKLLASTDDPMIHAGLNDIVADLALSTRGDLKPEGYQYDKKSIREPTNRSVGKFGIWTSTNDALFPHEPSPNDIKQGFAVEDCFLMAPLIQMASSDPQKIKDSMRDNGDGTVTVRFFKNSAQADQPKEPVFVTVNKTVNKLAGKANVYASSALWVQMMEKAYIEYLTQYVQTVPGTLGKKYEHSYNDINRSYSDQVLNALDEKKVYKTASPMFGFPMDEEAYKPGAAKAEKYAAYEDKMFRFFEEHVNRKKESIIVGNSGYVEKNAVYAKSHGIRTGHAYAMMGVFQQDGKMYVQLRDPYAVFRSKYDASGKLVNDQAAIGGTLKGGVSNMGTFNLEMKDFLQTYDSVLGMEENTLDELDALREEMIKVRDQDKPQINVDPSRLNQISAKDFEDLSDPIDPDEMSAKTDTRVEENASVERTSKIDDFADDFEEVDAPYSKALMDKLNEPGGRENIAETVKYLAEDLEKTAMFFRFMNTDNFKHMRDKLNSVNKKLQAGKYASNETLATELTELSELAETYANSKLDSVMKDLKNKKDPSLRAIHRLSDAVSLMGLKDGKTDVAQSVHGYAESMKIVKDDLVSMLKNSDIKPTAKEAVTRALDSVNNHIKNDAALNEQFTVLEKSDFPQNINTEPAVQKSQQRSATASIK